MWIGSSTDKISKPFGIKWRDEPTKAVGVFYSYYIKLLREKNFFERLDSVKKLINIWKLFTVFSRKVEGSSKGKQFFKTYFSSHPAAKEW